MMRFSKFVLLSFLLVTWSATHFDRASGMAFAQAQVPKIIADPAAFSIELIDELEKKGSDFISEKIGIALNNPGAKSLLSPAMSGIEKKKAGVAKIASDKSYGGVIRVVTIYTYGLIINNPYVYFQMTYKMSEIGWVMTGFNFKTEGPNAFPSEMLPFVE